MSKEIRMALKDRLKALTARDVLTTLITSPFALVAGSWTVIFLLLACIFFWVALMSLFALEIINVFSMILLGILMATIAFVPWIMWSAKKEKTA